MVRRPPKVGLLMSSKVYNIVNVGALNIFDDDAIVTIELLKEKGIIKR